MGRDLESARNEFSSRWSAETFPGDVVVRYQRGGATTRALRRGFSCEHFFRGYSPFVRRADGPKEPCPQAKTGGTGRDASRRATARDGPAGQCDTDQSLRLRAWQCG